jgi:hypothetical protein
MEGAETGVELYPLGPGGAHEPFAREPAERFRVILEAELVAARENA